MNQAEKYRGTPWEILYPELKPLVRPPTEEELIAAKSKEYKKEKRRKQKAARKVKSVQETVLRDNKQFSNWTI